MSIRPKQTSQAASLLTPSVPEEEPWSDNSHDSPEDNEGHSSSHLSCHGSQILSCLDDSWSWPLTEAGPVRSNSQPSDTLTPSKL